jgi:hypothetical protein
MAQRWSDEEIIGKQNENLKDPGFATQSGRKNGRKGDSLNGHQELDGRVVLRALEDVKDVGDVDLVQLAVGVELKVSENRGPCYDHFRQLALGPFVLDPVL